MRHINERFVADLLNGELAFFLNQVKNARDRLSLEIRNGYINIYYKGGSLLKITQKKTGYTFHFDAKYCNNKGNAENFELLKHLRSDDVAAYEQHFALMMQEMDSWFDAHPKPERDYQHQLLVNNPEIVDIEYQVGQRMRLDMLFFADGKLMIVENKYGTGAIGGEAGVAEHYKDIREIMHNDKLRNEMIDSVCHISQAKKALGLTDNIIEREDIKSVEILFLLANYNPKSQSLDKELDKMDGSVPTSVLKMDGTQVKISLKQMESAFAERHHE